MAQLDWYIRANLKPRHLQLLVALDDLRHLGQVAASLNITQPAVSLALGELERGLGFKLFDRTARGVQPNVYGVCLINHAREMLRTLAKARDDLRALRSGASGKTTLGALPAMTPALVPKALLRLKQQAPLTTVEVFEGAIETLLPELRRGHVDLIVGRLPPRHQADDLAELPLFEQASTVVVGRQHPLAQRRDLSWEDLADQPWVLPPPGSLPREPLETAFQTHGLAIPSNCIETLSVHVIATYLQDAPAVGLLSLSVAKHYSDLGQLVMLPLNLPDVLRPIGLVWSRQRPLTPAATTLMRCIEEASLAVRPEPAPPAPPRRRVKKNPAPSPMQG
ncbi:LysR substrate-binding domain-containing protein [Curvibacter fontanus]|jgi:DNA-binding transcriptional LysR family regulator